MDGSEKKTHKASGKEVNSIFADSAISLFPNG